MTKKKQETEGGRKREKNSEVKNERRNVTMTSLK